MLQKTIKRFALLSSALMILSMTSVPCSAGRTHFNGTSKKCIKKKNIFLEELVLELSRGCRVLLTRDCIPEDEDELESELVSFPQIEPPRKEEEAKMQQPDQTVEWGPDWLKAVEEFEEILKKYRVG